MIESMFRLIHSDLFILLCFICIIGLMLFGIFCITQDYLAKNKNSSLLYWRNSVQLADIVFYFARNIYTENTILAVKFFFSSDQKLKLVSMKLFFRVLRLKKLFEKLDDIADKLAPKEIISLGEPVLGPTMSPFLFKILDEDDLCFMNKLIADRLITEEELFSFCNLVVHKFYAQARLAIGYEQEQDPGIKAMLRQQIAQENIEISGMAFILVSHFIKKDKQVLTIVSRNENNELTYDVLKKIYPESSLVGELFQIEHDTIEHRYDLQQEISVGKLSPNYFLTQLEKNGHLAAAKKELNKLPDRPVTYYELPSIIQQNYLDVRKHFIKQTLNIGTIAGIVLILAWEYQYRVGFYTTKPHPRRIPF